MDSSQPSELSKRTPSSYESYAKSDNDAAIILGAAGLGMDISQTLAQHLTHQHGNAFYLGARYRHYSGENGLSQDISPTSDFLGPVPQYEYEKSKCQFGEAACEHHDLIGVGSQFFN